MPTDNQVLRLQMFTPANGDWVSIHADPETPDGSDPWTMEPIIGWAVLLRPDNEFEFLAVIGGEYIEVDGDSLGIYPRADLARPDIREAITTICNMVRDNHRARNRGCGAP